MPSTGGYGSYEIGRSKKYKNQGVPKSAAFKSETKIRDNELDTGDPGAYDAYSTSSVGGQSTQTFNKTATPFGSACPRELNVSIYGADTPGPGRYNPVRYEASIGASTNSFLSGSTQRPTSVTKTPGAGTYDPDVGSVKPVVNNSGASKQGHFNRFREAEAMTEDVGPGAYDSDYLQSLSSSAKELVKRGSKKMPPFGSTTDQRVSPFSTSSTPAPGSYYPLEPREKELRQPRGRSKSPARKASPGKKRSPSKQQ